jgi:hypothetical protein
MSKASKDKKLLEPAIPLYQYQTAATDCLYEAVLDNDFEVKMKGPKLVTKCRSFYLTSPLGSGKTRMIVRTINLVIKSDAFDDKVYSFNVGNETSILKSKSETKVLIIVPVSVVPQWQTELNLWKIDYYSIIQPKQIKPISEIKQKVIILSDYRTKDLKKDFFDEESQFYVFIDEYDTCNIAKTFTDLIFPYVKSKICVSANYDGKDYYPVPNDQVDLCRVIISDKAVKENIKLPDIKETILKFSLCPFLVKNFDDFNTNIVDNIKSGNIKYVFRSYGLSNDSPIDKFFAKFIKERRTDINDHRIKMQMSANQDDTFTKKVEAQCERLEKSIETHWKTCFGCKANNATLKDATNCISCYSYFCSNCAQNFTNDICEICTKIDKGVDIPGDGTSFFFKTRMQCFNKILHNIKSRKSLITDIVDTTLVQPDESCSASAELMKREEDDSSSSIPDLEPSTIAEATTQVTPKGYSKISEPSKKVLIYCSHPDLVSSLFKHLEDNNYWAQPLEGSSSVRMEKIANFKIADTDIYLVCNSIQNSAGIHLPETTDIIIFHELEDKYDTQVIGRAQRIGRKTPLHVHRIQE